MKKKTIKKKAPSYAFGIESALQVAGLATSALQGATEQGSDEVMSKGAVAAQTLGGAASGAMAGLSVGGPIGAAVGGVAGLLGGLFSGRKKRREQLRKQRIKKNREEIAMGKNNAATAEQNYWEENELASTFENGGILPNLAYVDNNEIIRDYTGNIMQVPNNRPGTDNHLIDASNLDSVLSDKLKRPGTNRTFAQEGKELVKMTKKSKGNDRFARTSDMLNSRYANMKYEQLLNEQEAVKAKKGIKPKVKGIPAYEDGKDGKQTRLVRWGDVKYGFPQRNSEYPDNAIVEIDNRGVVFDSNGMAIGRWKDPYLVSNPDVNNPLSVPELTVAPPNINNIPTPDAQEYSDEELYRMRMNTSGPHSQFYGGTLPEVTVTGTNIKKIREDRAREMADDLMIDWDPRIPAVMQIAAENDRERRRNEPAFDWTDGTIAVGINGLPLRGAYDRYRNRGGSADGITNETILVGDTTPDSGTLPERTTPANRPSGNNSATTRSTSTAPTSAPAPVSRNASDYLVPMQASAPTLEATTMAPNVEDIKINPKELPFKKIDQKDSNSTPFDFSSLAGLEPVIYNFARSFQSPEVEKTVQNPYAGAINRAMARRRINIEPTLAANRRSRAINRQNMARRNANTGMNLAYGNQLATAEYAQNADTYAYRDNANNQYLGEYANMMHNLGTQYVNSATYTNDINAQNRAAARNFGSTAVGQLGEWSQSRAQMRNQARRDAQLLPYLQDYLSSVTNVAKTNPITV